MFCFIAEILVFMTNACGLYIIMTLAYGGNPVVQQFLRERCTHQF